MAPAAPAAPAPPSGGGGNGGDDKPSLVRQMTSYAEEQKRELTKRLTSAADEARVALERNNTTVSMSASGVHVISDAGIHLPHELHLPRTGLSHEANSALGAVTAAVVASAAVSPVMTILDLSIIKAQLQKMSIVSAIKTTAGDIFRGRASWRPALPIMSTVYMSTYITANGVEAYCTEHGIDYKIPTALCTSLVNVAAIAWKDKAFARMMSKEPATFPLASYGLFALRDGLTVTSSFVLKNAFRDYLVEEHNVRPRNADLAASFAVPMLAQIPSTPLHILSLDLYSRRGATAASRVAEIAKGYFSVCSGRILRIIPAFGLGGFINDMVKESFEDEEEAMFLHMDRKPTFTK